MELQREPNPIAPRGWELPPLFPILARPERSAALAQAFASRARAFSCCLVFLFLPSIAQQAAIGFVWSDPRTVSLMLASVIFLRIVTLPENDAQLRRWGNSACVGMAVLLILSVFPRTVSSSEGMANQLLIALMISGCFSLQTSGFIAGWAVFASIYAMLVLRFHPGTEWTVLWLRLGSASVIAFLVKHTQALLCQLYNEITLTDEARREIYRQATEDARDAQSRFERLSNAGKEALILHRAGRIEDLNNLALELLGAKREELIGEPVSKILAKGFSRLATQPSDQKNSSLTRVKVIQRNGKTIEAYGFNHEIVFPDGAIAVLGLRWTERMVESEMKPDIFFQSTLRN